MLFALGRLDEAVDRLTAAQALEDSLDFHALAVRSAYWHARARLRRDGPGAARLLLDKVATRARKLGMSQLEQDADHVLAVPPAGCWRHGTCVGY